MGIDKRYIEFDVQVRPYVDPRLCPDADSKNDFVDHSSVEVILAAIFDVAAHYQHDM